MEDLVNSMEIKCTKCGCTEPPVVGLITAEDDHGIVVKGVRLECSNPNCLGERELDITW